MKTHKNRKYLTIASGYNEVNSIDLHIRFKCDAKPDGTYTVKGESFRIEPEDLGINLTTAVLLAETRSRLLIEVASYYWPPLNGAFDPPVLNDETATRAGQRFGVRMEKLHEIMCKELEEEIIPSFTKYNDNPKAESSKVALLKMIGMAHFFTVGRFYEFDEKREISPAAYFKVNDQPIDLEEFQLTCLPRLGFDLNASPNEIVMSMKSAIDQANASNKRELSMATEHQVQS